jgi:hypothetical protein
MDGSISISVSTLDGLPKNCCSDGCWSRFAREGQSSLANRSFHKLALIEPLFAFLEHHPDAWPVVSQLARSRAFSLAERVEDRVRMAVEAIEAARGPCDALEALISDTCHGRES